MSEQYCGEHDFYYSVNHIIDVICPWCEIDRLKGQLTEAKDAQAVAEKIWTGGVRGEEI